MEKLQLSYQDSGWLNPVIYHWCKTACQSLG